MFDKKLILGLLIGVVIGASLSMLFEFESLWAAVSPGDEHDASSSIVNIDDDVSDINSNSTANVTADAVGISSSPTSTSTSTSPSSPPMLLRKMLASERSAIVPFLNSSRPELNITMTTLNGDLPVGRLMTQIGLATAGSCTIYADDAVRQGRHRVIRVRRYTTVDSKSQCYIDGKQMLADTINPYISKKTPTVLRDRVKFGNLSPLFDKPLKKVVVAMGLWGYSWQHFVQDLLDIIGIFWDEIQSDPSVKILTDVGSAHYPQRGQIINLLGLKDRIITFTKEQEGSGYVPMEQLYYIHKWPSRIELPIPQGIQKIASVLTSKLCPNVTRNHVIFLRRPPGYSRTLSNGDALSSRIRKWIQKEFPERGLGLWGFFLYFDVSPSHRVSYHYDTVFKTYDPSKLSLEESLINMCSSLVVFHMHGGVLFHTITLPAGSLVVEFLPRTGRCITGENFNFALNHTFFSVGVDGSRRGHAPCRLHDEDMEETIRQLTPKMHQLLATLVS